jgi:enoyl-CoA hydratase
MSVDFTIENGVAVITLDDPATRNSLTGSAADDLHRHLRTVEDSADIRALIVRGAGGNFCSGASRELLGQVTDSPGDVTRVEEMERIYDSFAALATVSVPTIAAVSGAAAGAGVNLALAADVRIVGNSTRLISGFLKIGLHPGGGHFLMLDRQAGPQATVALTLLGDVLDGPELYRCGIAWDCVDDDHIDDRALRLASGAGEPALVRVATRTFRAQASSRQMPHAAASRAEQSAQFWSIARKGQVSQPSRGDQVDGDGVQKSVRRDPKSEISHP